MYTILLVEDDASVRAAMIRALADLRYKVHAVGTAVDALRETAGQNPDLVILDLGLPDIDGASALRMIRGVSDVPIIVATARRDDRSVVRLLNAGADDYLVKPFSVEHLAARVHALLRRTKGRTFAVQDEERVLEIGELKIDTAQRCASLGLQPLDLTRREFDLLVYLAERVGRVVSRQALVEDVWRGLDKGSDQTIDVHVSWLRRKLGESAASPRFLHTVRGIGLKLVEPR